jgi:hypothetical protein
LYDVLRGGASGEARHHGVPQGPAFGPSGRKRSELGLPAEVDRITEGCLLRWLVVVFFFISCGKKYNICSPNYLKDFKDIRFEEFCCSSKI